MDYKKLIEEKTKQQEGLTKQAQRLEQQKQETIKSIIGLSGAIKQLQDLQVEEKKKIK